MAEEKTLAEKRKRQPEKRTYVGRFRAIPVVMMWLPLMIRMATDSHAEDHERCPCFLLRTISRSSMRKTRRM